MSAPSHYDPKQVRLAKNFTLYELLRSEAATRHKIDNSIPLDCWEGSLFRNLILLAETVLQPVRDKFGLVWITSGYRCEMLNTLVGGSQTSDHKECLAADILTPGMSNYNLAQWIFENCEVDQVILEFDDWVHVSVAGVATGEHRQQALTAYHLPGGSPTVAYKPGIIPAHQLRGHADVTHTQV